MVPRNLFPTSSQKIYEIWLSKGLQMGDVISCYRPLGAPSGTIGAPVRFLRRKITQSGTRLPPELKITPNSDTEKRQKINQRLKSAAFLAPGLADCAQRFE